MPSSYETEGVYQLLLDAELQAVIGAVTNRLAKATYDGGQDVSDKVFLVQKKDVFGDEEGRCHLVRLVYARSGRAASRPHQGPTSNSPRLVVRFTDVSHYTRRDHLW